MCVTHVLAVLLTFHIADPVSVIVRRYAPSVYALFNSSVPQCCQILFQIKINCPRVHRVTLRTVYTVNILYIAEISNNELHFMYLAVAKATFDKRKYCKAFNLSVPEVLEPVVLQLNLVAFRC